MISLFVKNSEWIQSSYLAIFEVQLLIYKILQFLSYLWVPI